MNRSLSMLIIAAAAAIASAQSENIALDPASDAVPRRTNSGPPGPLPVNATIPDCLGVATLPWGPAPADVVHIIALFEGLVNPPGPLGIGNMPFNPRQYGPSPLYGFLEIDVDRDMDTGGEVTTSARFRYLANVARFGEIPRPPLTARAAFDGTELDGNFNTGPQVERNGADFALVLCGCFDITPPGTATDPDAVFGPGEQWIVVGRFFQRAGGYEGASASFGGSFFGAYDPVISVLFRHDATEDQTWLEALFPLTMAGAALLAAEPEQPFDLDVSNHVSIREALEDIIAGAAKNLPEPAKTFTRNWNGKSALNYLNPDTWRVRALFGTAYSTPMPDGALYIWTDAVGPHAFADFDASGNVGPPDLVKFDQELAQRDGSPRDADNTVNNSVTLPNPGPNFSAYDLNGDNHIDADDRALIPLPPPPILMGDANHDCVVDFADVTSVLTRWGTEIAPGDSNEGDANNDGAVNFTDLTAALSNWGALCSAPPNNVLPADPIRLP